jgi:hypothetical protein
VRKPRKSQSELRRAWREGISAGLRLHLPGAVGLVTKGVPLCAIAAFVHVVLGISVTASTVATVLAYIGMGRVP